ncbi:sigma-70 family RNA polymerase sigma factor [Pedobacter antarcticus]|uniref:sigma-70 family RNA polymerase sigma factor n=1 Tax=Pedobacter antarcticus TaxID=34086 RepID=UPI00088E507A|nr:sigma-70 family RNA polymerase sigma factor [Pedobacter antarcticus]SDM25902.1 RNA polymerase sigma-70 factor, ECF subfamily [Pedobacter antarcticus]
MEEQLFLKNINANKGIILKIVNLYADDSEDRKDLYQEIIYQAWKAVQGFKGEAKFSTWLYKISLNVSLTYLGKLKKHVKTFENISIPAYEMPKELSERSDRLYRAIRQLNEVDRGLIMLHLDGYDNASISEITGITKNNAGVKLYRIKQQLTDILNKK